MGVHGLWKLIEPSGQMVPLESLAGKVLAVDVSIWLHQAVKGMHDAHGAPLAVAHILILFHRVCKLLFYKIKPVFVFDGGVPALKRQTMATRKQRSNVAKNEAMKVREKLIRNLLKHEALRHMLSDETATVALGLNSFTLPGPSVEEDLYKLPPIAADSVDSESSDALSSGDEEEEKHGEDIHSIDVTSQEFLNLPPEVRHDILTELIETRKQSSWKHLDSMPKKSDGFSDFQMTRLLKRHAVQTSLEKAGKEMGGRALSLKELESLLGDQGVLDPKIDLPSRRIAQDSVTRYMLVQKDVENVSDINEGFDIMNHLEEVEWSSESDTDVILKKSPVKRMEEEKSKASIIHNAEEKSKDRFISKRPKVRVTKEVADILSILEDKNAATDVKVRIENLQTKVNLIDPNSEKKQPKNNESSILFHLEDSKPTVENIETDVSNIVVPAPPFVAKEAKCNEGIKEVEPTAWCNHSLVEKSQSSESTPQVAQVPVSCETANSSSDSESDFISITTEEAECMLNDDKLKIENTSKVQKDISNPLTVIINPSEASEKDDLFAEIFEKVPIESAPREEVKEIERETEKMGDEIHKEFQEQIAMGNLNELRRTLEEQHSDFLKQKGKQERLAANMNDQVYTDAQELLRLFGIPFLVAPMEAEAQCATLNLIGLTEGTITDDSDIWLFGGQVVYKNFFNQQKHVLEYRSDAIQKSFKLNREEMIKMALLVGSDYTAGLNGIGPVTALEIMAAFHNPNHELLDGLLKFRDWFTGTATGGPPRATLRKKIRNTVITPGFPNRAVVEAYLHPQVDESREPFSWAKPNLDLIHKYVRAKLGWSADKCNELLLPVMKKLEENTSQTTIDKHFKRLQKSPITDGMLSKRVENAIKRLGGEAIETEESAQQKPRKRRKPKAPAESHTESKMETKEFTKNVTRPATTRTESEELLKNPVRDENTKIKLINEKLHQNAKVPQKVMAQKLLEEKKKEAVKIFRTYKRGGKKKTRVYAKEEANLSESSSGDD